MTGPVAEQRAIISGIGKSQTGRRLGRTGLDLTLESALLAVADAGLAIGDIDGLATYPGTNAAAGGASLSEVQDALRLDLSWHGAYGEGPAQVTAFFHACLAVAAGLARHVLVYRTITEATSYAGGVDAVRLVKQVPGTDWMWPWMLPYGAATVPTWVAPIAMRHFHEFGTSREDLASVALTFRAHAGLDPTAVYREPLTREQYFAARMISSPLCLFDCDVPVDGSTAFVMSSADYAPDVPTTAVQVAGLGWAAGRRRPWAQMPDLYGAAMPAATQMWRRSGLTPDDVDVAGLYDGFSIIPLIWLESLGFCGLGESGQFIDGGRELTLGGRLPTNTNGGQLSGGRLHGYGFIHEAVLQLRGQAEGRQVEDAEVAVVTNGIGPAAGCMALTKMR